MSYEANTIGSKTLNSLTARAPNNVISAIKTASNRSGVDFSYLVQQAAAESSFNPHAKAKTSSATGLYQFIDSTWLSMVDKYGDKYGLDTDSLSKKEILNMRRDPKAASFMAAAFASENEKSLNNNWGGDVGATELYFAHFMGANGASSFLNARDENPMRPAADLFPRAARTNRNVFYDSNNGRAKSLEEVYRFFDNKFKFDNERIDNEKIATKPDFSVPFPDKKPANLYSPSRYSLSNNIVMQRSQAMREAAQAQNNYGRIMGLESLVANSINPQINSQKMPFFSLIAQPLDLMMLTQVSEPNKVVRDNS